MKINFLSEKLTKAAFYCSTRESHCHATISTFYLFISIYAGAQLKFPINRVDSSAGVVQVQLGAC